FVAERKIPIEVALLWETEEEIGSPNFREVVRAAADDLRCDGVIVSDTIWPSEHSPAISTALRGSLQVVLRLRTGDKDVHSGLTGGVARNPVRELARVATAIDDAGFWKEGVEPPAPEEVTGYAAAGFDPEYFKRAHALHKLETEVPLEMLLRLWTRPTWEVHGLAGGYQGPGVKTVVPHAAELKASFRLVAGQDPGAIGRRLTAFVAELAPDVEVEVTGFLGPYTGTTEGPIHDALLAGMERAFGARPVLVREGGSIGAVPILAEELGVSVHFLALSLPDHGYHAPNEYFDWRQGRGGIEAYVHVFERLAAG
ncbi:MAG: M20/M25/M40 family metallo-hydrolase, partial [Deltaproteobacteria bacterium]